ncbi:MAG: 6-phosphogluconolactonase [Parvularculaceae bacterium]|nr:MAG: 6-phosphogluconolactonase [Parvularculaceae bacterium]
MGAEPGLIVFPDRAQMAAHLAELISVSLAHGVSENGRARLAVSGGSTPKALYETLAATALPWAQTDIVLVDERWVPLEHPRSNEAFVRDAFAAAKDVRISGLFNAMLAPVAGADALNESVSDGQFDIDVAVLGLGPDGHTASWFPHADGLDIALHSDDPFCAVTAKKSDVTGEEVDRMTMTLGALARAKKIILLISGNDKKDAFYAACEDGPVEDMPVRAILRARPDLWACWAA